jgi:hypothetical protein
MSIPTRLHEQAWDRPSFAPETIQPKRNERDRIETKNSNINEADRYPAAHNGLVAGARTAPIVAESA